MEAYSSLQTEVEAYLGFFKRRLEVELFYVESLSKLSAKQHEIDRKLDEDARQVPQMTWRRAWPQVRSSLSEEATAHRALATRIEGLVASLTSFRDNKERMRRRIKEDVRTTSAEYSDYKVAVGRLRKTYERKVEEVQLHEESEVAREYERDREVGSWPPEHWIGSEGSGKEREGRNSLSSARSAEGGQSALQGPPLVAPVFVSGATSSSSGVGAYRDPPTGKANVLDAITKRDWSGEKQRLSSVVRAAVGNLKGEGAAGAGGVTKGRARQMGSKLRREAEQADRDYRAGVFRLETLRLQRDRVNRSATSSLHEFAFELSTELKATFNDYVKELVTVGHNEIAIAEYCVPDVLGIDPEQDATDLSLQTREVPTEPPVYYVNAFVGECRSLLFGVSIADYYAKHPGLLVPLVVQRCIAEIDKSGLEFEGLYRVSGKLATVQQLVHQIEKDEASFSFNDHPADPATIGGVLKLYLRQLPFPLFSFAAADRIVFSGEFDKDPDGKLSSLAKRIRRLSTPHQATMKALCEHLKRVADHSDVNKMHASNLGVVFSPVVFGEDEAATLESAMQSSKDLVMEILITHQRNLFEGLPMEPPATTRSRQGSFSQAGFSSPTSLKSASSISRDPVKAKEDLSLATPPLPPPRPIAPSPANDSPAGSFYDYSQEAAAYLKEGQPDVQPTSTPSLPDATPAQTSTSLPHALANALSSPTPPLSAAHGRHVSSSSTSSLS